MARFAFSINRDYELRIAQLANRSEEICKKAVYAGADVLTDAIRQNVNSIPGDLFRYLRDGDTFDGFTASPSIAKSQREDLANSLGITPIEKDADGFWNAKIGFDGYGSITTNKYPNGLPNQLVARSIESGSSVRQKHPFVAPAVRTKRKAARAAMEKVVTDEINKIMKG